MEEEPTSKLWENKDTNPEGYSRPDFDFDEQFKPHQLCYICLRVVKAIIESIHEAEKLEIVCVEELSTAGTLNKTCPYYESPESSLRSAEAGCHLCTLLVKSTHATDCCSSQHPLFIYADIFPAQKNEMGQGLRAIVQVIQYDDRGKTIHFPRNVPLNFHRVHNQGLKLENVPEHVGNPFESQFNWSKSTRSSSGFSMLRKWLQRCTTLHHDCLLKVGESRPTRLLDLDAFSSSNDLRLVQTDVTEVKAYATLSYRWGGTNRLVLTAGNQESLKSRIHIQSLPKTIQDAVEVCRRLSVRFLWVDALCIKQENGDDFTREIANMGAIYAGSLFTVAAADSVDSESGCFRRRFPLRGVPFLFKESDEISWCLDTHWGHCDHNDKVSHLDKRGWVFQEKLLSPRTIYFNHSDIVWECREETICYRCPQDGEAECKDLVETGGKAMVAKLIKGNGTFFHDEWMDLVYGYSRSKLTHEDDRLSALAGIAQLVQDNLCFKASYGLWIDFFIHQLLWQTRKPAPRFGELWHRIPSWSWVSVPNAVHWEIEGEREIYTAKITKYPPVTSFQQLSTLCGQTQNPASFRLKGFIAPCRVCPWFSSGWAYWGVIPWPEDLPIGTENDFRTIWDENLAGGFKSPLTSGRHWTRYHPDAPVDGPQNPVTLLLLRRTRTQESLIDTGIVIEKTRPRETVYKRTGYFVQSISEEAVREREWKALKKLPVSSQKVVTGHSEEELDGRINNATQSSSGTGAATSNEKWTLIDNIASDNSQNQHDISAIPEDFMRDIKDSDMIKHLVFFNGTETEAEIEII